MTDLKPGVYQHFKGNRYELLYIARHSETLEPMVVYRALYGEGGVWVRPAAMWFEHVEKEGYSGPRFKWVGEKKQRDEAGAPPRTPPKGAALKNPGIEGA